jgi:hypothetical protein
MTEPNRSRRPHEVADVVPLEITHDEISAAREAGDVTPLSNLITDIVRYRNHWWIVHTSTWLRVTDESTSARLDRHAEWANPRLLRDQG